MYEVDYYTNARGECPAREFIDGLSPKMKAKVFSRIELLEEYGPMLGMPFSRHLRDGIYELRTVQGGDINRILYFFVVGKRVILTHGFTKKTQKTPAREISKAERARVDWEERNE